MLVLLGMIIVIVSLNYPPGTSDRLTRMIIGLGVMAFGLYL